MQKMVYNPSETLRRKLAGNIMEATFSSASYTCDYMCGNTCACSCGRCGYCSCACSQDQYISTMDSDDWNGIWST